MGTGAARAACEKLYARLARPALPDRANRLGTVNSTGRHNETPVGPGAVKSRVALRTRESIALARALGGTGCRGTFPGRRENARDLFAKRGAVFWGGFQGKPP